MARSDRPLNDEERDEVTCCAGYARRLLGATDGARGEELQAAIHDAITRFRVSPDAFPGVSHEDLALCLGCLWGQVVCDECGWSWALVTLDDGDEVYGVVPPDRAQVVFPMAYVHDLLDEPAGHETNLVLYQTIQGRSLPEARPGEYLVLD
jgi:hypothetical protein